MGPTTPRVVTKLAEADSVAVIGLGRFGSALARELVRLGTEVLGIDADEDIVQAHNGVLTHVVRADSTNQEVLRQLALPDFDRVVVGIGSHVEASLLTTSLVLDFGVPSVWAKAVSDEHGRILERIGTHHVVYPEREMGQRVAHLVRGAMLDYLEVEEDFAIVKTEPPRELVGKTLAEAQIRAQHGVTVIAIRPPGGEWTHADQHTLLGEGDQIMVAGQTRRAEQFALLR